MNEVWKDVKGYEGVYQVSNLGRIKSLPRRFKNQFGLTNKYSKERILKPSDNKTGYLCLALSKEGKTKYKYVHRVVLEAFQTPLEDRLQCNHKNGNKYDNTLNNLEWVTPSENISHYYKELRHGKQCVSGQAPSLA